MKNRRWVFARSLAAAGLAFMALAAVPGRAVARIGCSPSTDPDCPLAVDDNYQISFGQSLAVDIAHGVLANDHGNSGLVVDVADSDTESFYGNATVVLHQGGWFTYTPDPATPFSGVDSFSYTISDAGYFDFATAYIEVDPVMKNDAYTTTFNTALNVAAPGVKANDRGDGFVDHWDATSVHGGTVTMDDNGGFVYTPAAGFSGADSFTYTVNDINIDNEFTATVKLTVLADGVTTTTPPSTTPGSTVPNNPPPPPKPNGYWMVGSDGAVYAFGKVSNYGNTPTFAATHLEPTPTRKGYWVVNSTGHVYAKGDAKSYGNAPLLPTGERVTSLSSTHSGHGYWLFTSRGRVFARGDATFYGDMSGKHLNGPVVGSVATTDGHGYFMVGSDGGIFTFGDAVFHGSMGNRHLNKPVNGLVPTKDGMGYWLVASDGGIFAFHAPYRGSMGGRHLNRPIIGMVRYGNGYLMVGSDGGIFNFSNQPFLGSLGGRPPSAPIVGVATGG